MPEDQAPADDSGWSEPRLLNLPSVEGPRGRLVPVDAATALPFAATRYFVLTDVPAGVVRGGHAQRRGRRLIWCVAGSCTAEVRHSSGHRVQRLADPATAWYLPPWTWVELRDFSPSAVVLVACSEPFDPADQVDLDEFLAVTGAGDA